MGILFFLVFLFCNVTRGMEGEVSDIGDVSKNIDLISDDPGSVIRVVKQQALLLIALSKHLKFDFDLTISPSANISHSPVADCVSPINLMDGFKFPLCSSPKNFTEEVRSNWINYFMNIVHKCKEYEDKESVRESYIHQMIFHIRHFLSDMCYFEKPLQIEDHIDVRFFVSKCRGESPVGVHLRETFRCSDIQEVLRENLDRISLIQRVVDVPVHLSFK